MKGYEAIVKVLKLEGIELISLFQAGGASGIMGTVTNESFKEGIRTVMARKERVAVNIADGYTRVGNISGKIGVAMVGTGVGAENAYSGVSQAGSDLVPMLILVSVYRLLSRTGLKDETSRCSLRLACSRQAHWPRRMKLTRTSSTLAASR